MGYIKEPEGVTFVVDPTPLTVEDRAKISEVIAHYKVTGEKTAIAKEKKGRLKSIDKKKLIA